MITQCSCCQMNSAGMHEWNCPMNPNNINQPPVVISGGYVPQDLVDKIANLQSQVTRLRDECEKLRAENERLMGIIERATEITPLNCKELLKTLDEAESVLNQPKGSK